MPLCQSVTMLVMPVVRRHLSWRLAASLKWNDIKFQVTACLLAMTHIPLAGANTSAALTKVSSICAKPWHYMSEASDLDSGGEEIRRHSPMSSIRWKVVIIKVD